MRTRTKKRPKNSIDITALSYLAEAFDVWRPPENISIIDWAEKYVYLPAHKTCPEPGYIRFRRTPYVRGVLEAYRSKYIDRIVLVWGRQTGKSSNCLYIPLCYSIAQDPGPSLLVLPNDALVEYTSENRIRPLFENCKPVWDRVSKNRYDYTTNEMIFNGAVISLVGAGSINQLISRPVRYLFLDEIDQIRETAGQGADPISTVEQTTTAFANRKIIYTSTPTTEDGNIWYHLRTCQRIFEYYVPCPHCKALQILIWPQIRWPADIRDPYEAGQSTWYECLHCKGRITDSDKDWMCNNGEWRARDNAVEGIMNDIVTPIENTIPLAAVLDDDRITKIGFHLPKWYALFHYTSFAECVRDFLRAHQEYKEFGTVEKYRDWTHYWAARPWKERLDTSKTLELEANKINLPSLIAPSDTVAITCGVDVGQNGYWYVVLAWRKDLSPHLVDYGFIAGEANLASLLWDGAYAVDGTDNYMAIWRAGIDTGGSRYEDSDETMTEATYNFIREYGRNKIVGTKGVSFKMGKKMKPSVIDRMPGGDRIAGGLMLWLLDTEQLKDAIKYRLQLPPEHPGRFTFHAETAPDFMAHMLSEEKRINKKTGKHEWVKVKKHNHWLDACVIAFALADPECQGGVRGLLAQQAARSTGRRVIYRGIDEISE